MSASLKIVVLDGYALNPGDLDWSGLTRLGECTIFDRTPSELILDRATGAQVVLTNKTPLGRQTLSQLKDLQYIGVLATGYNIVDTEAAREFGITVCNVPAYGTLAVVQLTFALILELTHRVQRHSDAVMSGRWSQSPDWCFWDYPLTELAGKTMGIIGLGNIGKGVAKVAQAFGMNIIASRRSGIDDYPKIQDIERVAFSALLSQSDIISIHCPLTPETQGFINRESLSMMKHGALIINTSRGPLIHEGDLAHALATGMIGGAALDVLSLEPPPASHPLYNAPNCIITPHIAWATREARQRLMHSAIQNIESWRSGCVQNQVNAW